jgi:hypothetical protein
MPIVDDAGDVTAASAIRPRAIVFVGANGAVTLASGTGWKGELPTERKPVADVRRLASQIGIEDASGTAMALEEGKMGKKDSDRSAGAYNMKRTEDPQLARQQAIEAARNAGILGPRGGMTGVPAEELAEAPLFVFAPTVPAGSVMQLMRLVGGGTLAVSHRDRLHVFGHAFRDEPGSSSFSGIDGGIEVHVDANAVHVLVVGEEPTAFALGDRAALRGALDALRGRVEPQVVPLRGTTDPPVDVLVEPTQVTAQQLLATLGAIGSGYTLRPLDEPSAGRVARLRERAQLRKEKVPTVSIGQPNATGDLDKAIIRRYIKRNLAKISACYEKELVNKPDLKGTVLAQFYIEPTGKVSTSTASGLDPAVATCVADVIKAIEFPKPKGGGGVQVNYPFAFRPQD